MPYIGRADFNYRIVIWDGDHKADEPAGVDDFDMAQACYDIAKQKHPDLLVTLQQGIRVIRRSDRE